MSSLDALPGAMLTVNTMGRVQDIGTIAAELVPALGRGADLFGAMDSAAAAHFKTLLATNAKENIYGVAFEALLSQRRFLILPGAQLGSDGTLMIQLTELHDDPAVPPGFLGQQRIEPLFSESPDLTYTLDPNGSFLEVNCLAEDLIGFTEKELFSHSFGEYVELRDQQTVEANLHAVLEGNPSSFRCRIIHRNGQVTVARVTQIPEVVDGQVVRVRGAAWNQTDQYRLEESSRLFSVCMDQIQDVVIITESAPLDDPGPRILFVNGAIEQMAGYLPEDLIGRSPRILQGPATDRGTLDRIRNALEARQPITEVVANYRKDGTPFWSEIKLVPISAKEAGGREYWVAVQRDITQRKNREIQLQRSQEDLRRLNRAQGNILEKERRRIARDLHDQLGQALTATKLNFSMAIHGLTGLPQAQNQRLEQLVESIDAVIDQVREIASNLRPAMLDDLGFEAAAEWFLDQCASRKDMEIHWHPLTVNGGTVKGDVGTALFRILQECMTNISRHAHASSVNIKYEERASQARLTIQDDGVGFDPRTPRAEGLGLVGMRERVAMLGGNLTVESAHGKGVRITVTLPLDTKQND